MVKIREGQRAGAGETTQPIQAFGREASTNEGGEGKNIEPAWHERIFQLLPQWSSTMSLSTFDSVTTVLAKKALETPRDPLVIKILRLIGKGIDNGRDAIQKSRASISVPCISDS